MKINTLTAFLFDTLQTFDRENTPFGLYSLDDTFKKRGFDYTGEMSKRALWPAVFALGCEANYEYDSYSWRYNYQNLTFITPDSDLVTLWLERVAFTKVREFGNAYHVDKSIDHKERWEALGLASRIKQLARSTSVTTGIQMQLVLLVGFDKGPHPLGVEIRQLQTDLGSILDELSFFERTWPDASGRGFTIRACNWAKLEADN